MPNTRLMEDVLTALHSSLPFDVPNYRKRIKIWCETDKYRWREDESVWRQKRGYSAEAYEVYFDGEFVCFFDQSFTMDSAVLAILEGLVELIRNEKVFLNEEVYKVKAAEQELINKAQQEVVIAKPTSPEEKIIAEVLTRQAKKRNKKVKTK